MKLKDIGSAPDSRNMLQGTADGCKAVGDV